MSKPNVVFILADNLGWGELGCYGGGVLRGAPTPRIDGLADQGLRLTNFNVESDCVPTRSALMTGRQPMRTGAWQSKPPNLPQGMSEWEVTLAEQFKSAGYSTAMYGKWHLGDAPGRLPHDRGFDEWYGVPRTSDEVFFETSIGFDPSVAITPQIFEATAGSDAKPVGPYDLDARRTIDTEITDRAIRFMDHHKDSSDPFFLFLPIINMHFPTLPHSDYAGSTGYGDMADCLAEMDGHVGRIVDALDDLGLAEDTLLVFASDNGPEFRQPWRGTAGPWRGTYHTAMEGSLRVPCIIRWPERIKPEQVSDEMVHISDFYTTLTNLIGQEVPSDRAIDGVDQAPVLLDGSGTSAREGFPFYIKGELHAVKWRDWKMHLHWHPEVNEGKGKLESPYLFNVKTDMKEEYDIFVTNTWVAGPIMRLIQDYERSMQEFPNVSPGANGPPTRGA
jgi:arylsulfatase